MLGVAAWVALLDSGVEPLVIGLVMGLLTYAYTPALDDLERATGLFRSFREQPTPELARSATAGLTAALSPNERLLQLYHPWTSYVIVPLFALANAGIAINGEFLARAATSAITLGIVVGYVVGKPLGIVGFSWLLTRLSRGRLRPPVGWAAIAGTGAIAGIGFTVSLLVATLAFDGAQLEEAKLGVLSAALLAAAASWVVFRVTLMLSPGRRTRALLGTAETIVDLDEPVDPDRDHIRGPAESLGDPRRVRRLRMPVLRPGRAGGARTARRARRCAVCVAAPAAERRAPACADRGGGRRGRRQPGRVLADARSAARSPGRPASLRPGRHAEGLGLDVERFRDDLRRHTYRTRVAEDVESASGSGVSGTPTFFINGRRHYGAYDIDALTSAVRTAKARAAISSQPS